MRLSQVSGSVGMSTLYLNQATRDARKSSQRLASGKKLTTDLVGDLGRLNTMKGHRNTIKVELDNLHSANDYANVKDGALSQIIELAQQISEDYASGKTSTDAGIAQKTADLLDIISSTQFNGQDVFSTSGVAIGNITISSEIRTLTADDNFKDVDTTKASLEKILKEAAQTGAIVNGIDARIGVNTTMQQNLDEAISRIEEVDITEETLKYNEHLMRQQLAASMITRQQENQMSLINLLV